MSGGNNSIVTKLTARIFPVMPDFYGMMVEHCDLVARAMDVFLAFMETGDVAKGEQVRAMEKEGDELKSRQMEVLNHAFATPMDREDIYRAIMAIDEILNYAKTTIREMEALDVQPDAHMAEIARLLRDGTHSLRDGYAKLSVKPMDGEADAAAARKAERKMEQTYRRALVHLYDRDTNLKLLVQKSDATAADALSMALDIFRTREIYRDMYGAADKLLEASRVLHDIVVKIA